MCRVISKIVVFMFYGLLGAVFFFTASLTYDLLTRIMPNDNITPIFGLALFDIGALIWLLTFLKKARGLGQRGVCLMSRSWNRIVANGGFERGNFSLLLKGWYRIPEAAADE